MPVKRLNHAGISPQGVVFNDMALRLGAYGTYAKVTSAGQLGFAAG